MGKLNDQLETLAKSYDITVIDDGREIELTLPQGYRFEVGLHCLVSSPWDNERYLQVLRKAIADVQEHGPYIEICDDKECDCQLGAED
tara:strand:+ start:174 stop:437 length:264 start_codon:yes stop_codon:yes gene_type:complete